MASYTDNTRALSSFSPYVQQLPVESMVSVGMQKQAQYDQGIQKIQTSIDNVAGLEVMRDVDKQYLQSRLNNLGTNLKSVAAADFSNNQLVTSTAGMAAQIGKDKNIQNAVYSTTNHRKQLSVMDAAKLKGESAPENEVDYQKQLMQYMNSNKVGDVFSGQYTPYINVNEKLFAIGKEVGLDESTVQQLFKTDENGKTLINKDGTPEFNPVMVERHLKGKDPAKILLAFQNALTPADYNQLAITGRYAKSGMSSEQLTREIVNNYSKDILFSKGKVTELDLALTKANSENKKDNILIDSLNKQRDFFLQQKDSLETSQTKDIQRVSVNPDGVRANLYTNNYLSSMARTLSSSVKEELNKITPQFQVSMEINKFNHTIQQDKLNSQHWDMDYKLKVEDKLYNREKDRLEFEAKYGKVGGTPGTDIPLDLTKTDKYTMVGAVEGDYSDKVAQYNSGNNDLVTEFLKETYPPNPDEHPFDYNKRMKMELSKLAIAQGKSINPNSGDINPFAEEFAAQKLTEWTKDDKAIPLKFRSLIEQQHKLMTDLSIQKGKMERINKEAIEELKSLGISSLSTDEIKTRIKPITVTLNTGTTKTLNSSDLIDFTNIHPELYNIFGNLSIDKQQQQNKESSYERLLLKFGNSFSDIEKQLYVKTAVGSSVTVVPHTSLREISNITSNVDYSKLKEIEARKYVEEGFIKSAKQYPLVRGKETKDDVNNKIVGIINNYKNNLTGHDETKTNELINSILNGKERGINFIVTPGISSNSPVTYDMIVTPETGKAMPIRITEQEFSSLSGQLPKTNIEEPLILKQLNATGTSTFPSKDFINLKGVDYTVTGSLEYATGTKNLVYNLYIHKKGEYTPEKLTFPEVIPAFNNDMSYNQTLDALPTWVTSARIEQLRNTK